MTSTTDVWGQVLNYTYDANDRRTKLSFGATTNATYTYDVLNRVTKITDAANKATSIAYDATGKVTSRTLPNSVVTTYTYDGLDRLTRLKDAKNNTVIADSNYAYNSAGAITQNIDQSGTHAYGYDAMDRLISATYTGTPNETYAYDGVGNRTNSHRSATYGYQPFNRLTSSSSATYSYDNNGNMISKTEGTGTTQFAWDFENRLTQVVTPANGSVTYKYDALGRRVQSAPSTGVSTNFTYDGQDVVQDKTSAGVITEYLNGPGIDNKIRQKTGTTLYYFAQDHLGSTTALTDSKGALVERQAYDAYGNSAGSTRTRYGFTGRERDSLTGLQYNRARFYDPQLERLISEDPIGLSGGINQFAYVSNNPQNRIDPSGLYEIDVHYYLTYYLAMQTGCFSDAEAREIANGDQYVDENPKTKPGFGGNTPVADPRPNYEQQQANIDYHALHDGSHQPYLDMHWRRALTGPSLSALGIYLHYLQDTFSHRTFTDPLYGHSPAHGGSHADDKTDEDVDKAMEMAIATFDALKRFAQQTGRLCRCTNGPDWDKVRRFAQAPGGNSVTRRAYDIEHVNPWYLNNKIQILGVPWR